MKNNKKHSKKIGSVLTRVSHLQCCIGFAWLALCGTAALASTTVSSMQDRSEERRVGKEC